MKDKLFVNNCRVDPSTWKEYKIVYDISKVEYLKNVLSNKTESLRLLSEQVENGEVDMHIENVSRFVNENLFPIFKKPVKRDGINTNVKAKANRWFNSDCYRAKQDFKVARNAFIRNKTDTNRNVEM